MMVIQQDKYKYNVAFDFDPQSDSTLMVAKEPALRKGAEGVSTSGVTAISFQVFDGGTFWVLPLTTFIFPKVPGRSFFPKASKLVTFAAAPVVLTPSVRNQHATLSPDCFVIRGDPGSCLVDPYSFRRCSGVCQCSFIV